MFNEIIFHTENHSNFNIIGIFIIPCCHTCLVSVTYVLFYLSASNLLCSLPRRLSNDKSTKRNKGKIKVDVKSSFKISNKCGGKRTFEMANKIGGTNTFEMTKKMSQKHRC